MEQILLFFKCGKSPIKEFNKKTIVVCMNLCPTTVDDRTEPKIPKFRCFGNFGSVRFGSVRLEKTEPKQIAEFRFKKYTVGKKIEKKSSSKSFSLSLL